ncbi:MAG TPA: hypothetical protein DCY42_07480 [Chloroflexi bacterium]|nr:hypothetical protein [Chloroflexota bacterium]
MDQNRTSSQTREIIFRACSQILRREGLTNLTLQAVASEAGLSKGGLLYHFETKEALIEALFEYHNSIFEDRLKELLALEGEKTGAFLRAYAKASVEQMTNPENASLYASLFAAEEKYASAHKLMREKYVNWQNEIYQTGLDPNWALFLRFAVDGLWFAEMHRYAPPSLEQREEIVEMILKLTHYTEEPGK